MKQAERRTKMEQFIQKMMKAENNITININELDSNELEALAKILYGHGHMRECKEVNERKAWMEA